MISYDQMVRNYLMEPCILFTSKKLCLVRWTTLNTTIPKSLSCCCRGEEEAQIKAVVNSKLLVTEHKMMV